MTVAMAAPRMPMAGQPSRPKDHNGVENNVDYCADDEGDHRQHRVPHGLQEPLPVGLQKMPQQNTRFTERYSRQSCCSSGRSSEQQQSIREQQPHQRKHQ